MRKILYTLPLLALLGACSLGHSTHEEDDTLTFGNKDTAPAATAGEEYASPATSTSGTAAKCPNTNYAEVFNDSNYVHYADAEKIGLKPLSTTRSFWQMERGLVKIADCEEFHLEQLTHSEPYLVPEAAAMVHEIGRRFRDSVHARGLGDYRVCVTSVLRTPEHVRRLRRVNPNAIDSSVHCLGTTIDIAYNHYAPRSEADDHATAVQLKTTLADVLYAMRQEGKCWVKYERKQPCFHITARGQKKN